MPSSSSFCAMISLSSTENETASPCVPSRSVVSNVWMRMELLGDRRGLLLLRYAFLLLLFQERHHLPEFFAHALDRLLARCLAHGQELVTASLVFLNPLAGELAGLNLGQDLLHLLACLAGD